MSKAKELAREILAQVDELFMGPVSRDLFLALIYSVLEETESVGISIDSEPEPDLKGWIETEAPYNKELRMLINLTTGTKLMETTHSSIGCYLRVLNSDNDTDLKESYDEIKQLIARAS